jgi:hypothetical protein
MTTLQKVCEARGDDAIEAFAEYQETPRWRWFKRGKLLDRAHLLALEYERLRLRALLEQHDH